MEATIVILVLFMGNKNVSLTDRSYSCGEVKNSKKHTCNSNWKMGRNNEKQKLIKKLSKCNKTVSTKLKFQKFNVD